MTCPDRPEKCGPPLQRMGWSGRAMRVGQCRLDPWRGRVEKLTAPHGSAGDDGAADDGTAPRDEISVGSGDRPPPPRVAVPGTSDPLGDFEKFYVANFDRLIVQLYAYTADMAQAQDVVQEAFARAL